jgi:hypothetical protein
MLDRETSHWKVLGITGRQTSADGSSRGRDEAVGLG